MVAAFFRLGWTRFGHDAAVADWARHARRSALAVLQDPAQAHWWQCQGTWFVGVDALDNDAAGRIAGSPPLSGTAVDFIARHIGPLPPLHRAQLSVVRPGYPRPRDSDTEAAFRYRRNRDAAHLDGLLAIGPGRRRMLREPHSFILGLPLGPADPGAAPLVVWEGSHDVMREALTTALSGHAPADWPDIDLTEPYKAARRTVFASCRRVPLPGAPGEACLLHRLTLHGIAPWADTATAAPEGRMIAYFRPPVPGGAGPWLTDP